LSSTLASYLVATSDPVTLQLRAVGNRLYGYVNGTLRLTATDGTYTSGRPGLWFFDQVGTGSTAFRYDNFSGGLMVSDQVNAAVKVAATPSRIYSFERDDDQVRVIVAHGGSVTAFDAGSPEW
jgi:hypothetical protein